MPLVIRVPAIRSNVILIELAHEVKPNSLYIHVYPKHDVEPCPVQINLIDHLSHHFGHSCVMVLINVSSDPGFYGKVLVMGQLPDIVSS